MVRHPPAARWRQRAAKRSPRLPIDGWRYPNQVRSTTDLDRTTSVRQANRKVYPGGSPAGGSPRFEPRCAQRSRPTTPTDTKPMRTANMMLSARDISPTGYPPASSAPTAAHRAPQAPTTDAEHRAHAKPSGSARGFPITVVRCRLSRGMIARGAVGGGSLLIRSSMVDRRTPRWAGERLAHRTPPSASASESARAGACVAAQRRSHLRASAHRDATYPRSTRRAPPWTECQVLPSRECSQLGSTAKGGRIAQWESRAIELTGIGSWRSSVRSVY